MTILQDVRYALRNMLKNPGFSFLVILTLALGIGATTAIFSVVNGVILRPLPYPEPGRLVQIWFENQPQEIKDAFVSLPDFKDIQERSRTLESVAVWEIVGYNLWGAAEPERLTTGLASRDYFKILGARPVLGRLFDASDEVWGNHRVALISYDLWQRHFGGDPKVIGKSVTIDGFQFKVLGVLSRKFDRPVPNTADKPDLWRAFAFPPTAVLPRNHRPFYSVARLKPGVTVKQAQEELSQIARDLERQYPDTNRSWEVKVLSLQSSVMGNVRRALLILSGAVAFVLLIACVNVANLLLARAEARDREFAIRNALGAGRRRVIQQLFAESLLLALLAGGLGLLLSYWATAALVASHAQVIPRLEEIALNGRVVAFAMGVSLLTALAFGLAPAWKSSRSQPQTTLRQTGTLSPARGRHRLSLLLVVCEVSLALVLLVGAGLLIRTFNTLRATNLGFSTDRVMTLEMALPWIKYGEAPKKVALFDQLLPRLQALPGVEKVAAVSKLPLKEPIEPVDVWVEGRPAAAGQVPKAYPSIISPDYFSVMGISLLQGRAFTNRDRAETEGVVIVNQTLARRFWPGQNPVGRRISLDPPGSKDYKLLTVVGLINDVRHVGLDTDPSPEIYTPLAQSTFWTINVVVKTKSSRPETMAPTVRKAIVSLDPDQAIYDVKTMDEVASESLLLRRFSLFIFTIFAVIALVLAAIGIYGVMAYSVAQRRQEIGLRMALGAQPPQVFKLVLGQGMRYVVVGLALGLLLSLALARLLASLLYGVGSFDPATFGSVLVLLALVALLANFLPARRAAKVDPLRAMKT
jgi:putative ABC transport system permease protein